MSRAYDSYQPYPWEAYIDSSREEFSKDAAKKFKMTILEMEGNTVSASEHRQNITE